MAIRLSSWTLGSSWLIPYGTAGLTAAPVTAIITPVLAIIPASAIIAPVISSFAAIVAPVIPSVPPAAHTRLPCRPRTILTRSLHLINLLDRFSPTPYLLAGHN